MSGFSKYDRILRLFREADHSMTANEIARELGATLSTTYRLVRELASAGFIESTMGSGYRLGPVFIEFDRKLRLTDPLNQAREGFLLPLVQQADISGSAFLCRLYGEQVMCVAEAHTPDFRNVTSYDRGRPMPISRGATSKVILASIDARRRRRLINRYGPTDEETREQLLKDLSQIRKDGFCITHGEVDANVRGIAAPVCNEKLGVFASLSFVMRESDADASTDAKIASLVGMQARMIERFLLESFKDAGEGTS